MRSIFALLTFTLFTAVSASAFSFGPERAVSSSAYGPPVGEQRPGAVATDGSAFTVFWSDATARAGLYFTRVSAAGEVSGALQVPIRSGMVRSIRAAWTGSIYLVTWRDDASDSFMSATVSRDGALVTGPEVVARGAVGTVSALASNGRRALLVYLTQPASEARGALFDSDGRLLRAGIPLPLDSGTASVHVASDTERFAIIWSVASQQGPLRQTYRFVRVNDEAEPVDSSPVIVGEIAQSSSMGLTYGGGKWGFAALERQSGEAVLVRRFTIDRTSLAVETLPAVSAAGFGGGVLWNGNDFLSYWTRFSLAEFDLMILPFMGSSPRGTLHRGTLGLDPILVSNEANVLAVWLDRIALTQGADVAAALLDRNATAVESGRSVVQLALGAAAQETVALASSPVGSLVVWTERRSDAETGLLMAARVASDGTPAGEPVQLATDVPSTPAGVAYTGAGYLVVWSRAEGNGSAVFSRFVAPDGTLGDTIRLGAGYSPSVAASANLALVVFDTGGAALALLRLNPRGTLLDSAPLPFVAGNYGDLPHVASNGSDFLVVWSVGSDHWLFGTRDAIDVLSARVRENGSVDAVALPIATGPQNQSVPVAASDGRDYVVAYLIGYQPQKQVAFKRVLREGALAEGSSADEGKKFTDPGAVRVALSFTGDSYIAGWNVDRDGRREVKAARVSREGAPSGSAVTIDGGTSVAIGDVAGPGFLLAYARYAPEAPFVAASRVFVRTAGEAPSRARAVRR